MFRNSQEISNGQFVHQDRNVIAAKSLRIYMHAHLSKIPIGSSILSSVSTQMFTEIYPGHLCKSHYANFRITSIRYDVMDDFVVFFEKAYFHAPFTHFSLNCLLDNWYTNYAHTKCCLRIN